MRRSKWRRSRRLQKLEEEEWGNRTGARGIKEEEREDEVEEVEEEVGEDWSEGGRGLEIWEEDGKLIAEYKLWPLVAWFFWRLMLWSGVVCFSSPDRQSIWEAGRQTDGGTNRQTKHQIETERAPDTHSLTERWKEHLRERGRAKDRDRETETERDTERRAQ